MSELLLRRNAMMSGGERTPPLPTGYTRYDWVQVTNGSSSNCIDTGIVGTYTASRYRITAVTMPLSNTQTSTSGIFGARAGTGTSNIPNACVQFAAHYNVLRAITGCQYNGYSVSTSNVIRYLRKCKLELYGTTVKLNGKTITTSAEGTTNLSSTRTLVSSRDRTSSRGSYRQSDNSRRHHYQRFK